MKTDNARYKHVGDVLVVRSAGDAGGESRGAGQDLGGGIQNLEGCKKIMMQLKAKTSASVQ